MPRLTSGAFDFFAIVIDFDSDVSLSCLAVSQTCPKPRAAGLLIFGFGNYPAPGLSGAPGGLNWPAQGYNRGPRRWVMPNDKQKETYGFIRAQIESLRTYVPRPKEVSELIDCENPGAEGYLGPDGRKVALFKVDGARVFIEENGRVFDDGMPDCPRYSTLVARDFLHAIAADLLVAGNPHKSFLDINSHTPESFKSYLQTGIPLQREMPFPIAIVSRKMGNEGNGLRSFLLLRDLFEVVVRFVVLVQIADCMRQSQPAREEVVKKNDLKFRGGPTLGKLVTLFCSLRQVRVENPFLREIASSAIDEEMLRGFVELRNITIGHGTTQPDAYYKSVFEQNIGKMESLLHAVGFLRNYWLVKVIAITHAGPDCEFSAWKLTGGNPCFDKRNLRARGPLTAGKVYYLNRDLETLELDPYVIVETCNQCDREELLLFDGFPKEKESLDLEYFGYESCPKVHKSSYPYAYRLPSELRRVTGGA